MKALGQYLNAARVKRQITLRQMAREVAISAMYLSELENGKKVPINGDVLPRLADYLGIEPSKLLALALKDKEAAVLERHVVDERIAVARELRTISPATLKEVKRLIDKDKEDQ